MATRKVIRPKFASVQDGYSRESIEDMLVAWSAFWADVPEAQERIESLRTDEAAEPLLASVWTLRMSKDELALERAKKRLEETQPLGAVVVGLALRDPEFGRSLHSFGAHIPSFELWLSTLVAGRASRLQLARGLVRLWFHSTSSWNPETGWFNTRTLDEPRSRAFEALLDSPIEEVRGAVAASLTDIWPSDSWLSELLLARLEDPVVGTPTCKWLHYARLSKERVCGRIKDVFSVELPHRVDLLATMASLGDLAPALTHFSTLRAKEQLALLSVFWNSAAGKRFLADVVRNERLERQVRRDAYMMLGAPEELEAFASLVSQ